MVTLNYTKLGAAIEDSGLKKGIIAQKMQVSARTLTDSINDKRLTVDYLLKICQVIGRHPCEFFTGPEGEQMVNEPSVQYGLNYLFDIIKIKDEQIKMLIQQQKR